MGKKLDFLLQEMNREINTTLSKTSGAGEPGMQITTLGLEIKTLLQPDPKVIMDLTQKTYNVFYVPDAVGNEYVPVQKEFVIPFGVRSVIGFGGILPSGNLYATILFSRARVPVETAEMFKTLALSMRIALLPFVGGTVFG